MKKRKEFNFCIARYWETDSKQLCVYSILSCEVLYGTKKYAREILKYVVETENDTSYFICKVKPL